LDNTLLEIKLVAKLAMLYQLSTLNKNTLKEKTISLCNH